MNLKLLTMPTGGWIGIIVAAMVIAVGLSILIKFLVDQNRTSSADKRAKALIDDAKKEAEKIKNDTIRKGMDEIQRLKQEEIKDLNERKRLVKDQEEKLVNRENRLDNRSENLDQRENNINAKEANVEKVREEVEKEYQKAEQIVKDQEKKLLEISGITRDDAKKIVLEQAKDQMSSVIANYIREEEEKAKNEAGRRAQYLLAEAIDYYSSDVVSERTVSTIDIPNDEMKGRIIGREGRNIRTIEAATGADLIVDDTPNAVVVSCFEPIRREIAKRVMQTLVKDGRIQPPRVEELVKKYQAEVDQEIREAGEEAVFVAGIGKVHPELVKIIGRLKFRTSYGQNALRHCLEVGFFTGKLAAELGLNQTLAKRCGFFHDIGKALDHENEGSHVEVGLDIVRKYNECPEVIEAVGKHHGEEECEYIYTHLVRAADTLSAARPGARNESVENYIKRLEQLENICTSYEGVEKAYAVQAGREVRVMVKPGEVDDDKAFLIAREIKKQIENDVNYPGTVKVVVIRETRATEVAR